MRFDAIATLINAYFTTRWRSIRLNSREAIRGHQDRQLAILTRRVVRDMPFYRTFVDQPFDRWPVIDKAVLHANFSGMNRVGLNAEAVHTAIAEGKERLAGYLIGRSTGTSGNRGCYLITEAERFMWLGTILAKALPDALWRRHRVALALPALSGLYRSASIGSRIALAFFDLAAGPETWVEDLTDFAPDTIVAPPKVLRWLAERKKLGARNIFSGAEVLDPLDRGQIENITGQRVREIYMATEGLFGVSCSHGTLHLAEDVVYFEYSKPDPAGVLVSPIVTDFTRRAQAMIRYRMNDLMELDPMPCPCGLAFQAVKRIEGRCDDTFLLADEAGVIQLVTPDIIRNAIVDADPAIRDYRAVQTDAAKIVVNLATALPSDVDARVYTALCAVLRRRGLKAEISIQRGIITTFTHKLRRVSRQWQPPPNLDRLQ